MLSASRYICGSATVRGSSEPTSLATICLKSFRIASPDGERATTSAKAVVSACIAAFETTLCRSTCSSTYRFVTKNIESPQGVKASNMNAASNRGKSLTALVHALGAQRNSNSSSGVEQRSSLASPLARRWAKKSRAPIQFGPILIPHQTETIHHTSAIITSAPVRIGNSSGFVPLPNHSKRRGCHAGSGQQGVSVRFSRRHRPHGYLLGNVSLIASPKAFATISVAHPMLAKASGRVGV